MNTSLLAAADPDIWPSYATQTALDGVCFTTMVAS
jgi:hypothetical protein